MPQADFEKWISPLLQRVMPNPPKWRDYTAPLESETTFKT